MSHVAPVPFRGRDPAAHPGTGNSSDGGMLGSWSCWMQRRGFHPPLSLRTGIFSIGVNMGYDSIPSLGLKRPWTFMSWMGECRQQKHTQHTPSTNTRCDYLCGWIKKRSHTQKFQRERERERERERREREKGGGGGGGDEP